MNSNLKLLPAALLVAMLALAGCGGGGSDDVTPTDPMPTPEPPANALEDAVDAQRAAAAASEAAAGLLDAAAKASAATVATAVAMEVDGSSQGAYDNVMTVLGSEAAVEAERMKAANAVTAIEGIDTSAMSAAEMARIADILENAEESLAEIVAIQEAKGAGSLAKAVADVKAGSALDATAAKIAQAKADGVATAVDNAIAGVISGFTSAVVANTVANDAVMMTPNPGMTFEQISGSARMAATMIGDFTSTSDLTTPLAALTATGQGGTEAVAYMGIPGDLICYSVTCGVTDGKITGTVEFTPDNPDTLWIMASAGAVYTTLTNVGNYGYWLTDADAINMRADSPSAGISWNRPAAATSNVEASYSGNAGGFSERTVGTGDDTKQSSGEFTANVTLNATFGDTTANANLNGSISGFAGGSHVNPDWYVRLNEQVGITGDVTTGAVTSASMPGKEDATAGTWTADAYGESGMNPSGFVGAFHATFDDGTAAGVYSASKD